MPPAWVGKKPAREKVLEELQQKLKVLTVTEGLELVVPSDHDIPVALTAELKQTLEEVRQQYGAKQPPEKKDQPKDDTAGGDLEQRFASLAECESKCDVVAKVVKSAYTILLGTEKGAGGHFDATENKHFLMLHNHSTSARCDLDAGMGLFGGRPGQNREGRSSRVRCLCAQFSVVDVPSPWEQGSLEWERN